MSISSTSAKELVRMGVDLEISDEAGYSSTSVKEIIRIAVKTGSHIKVHAASYSSTSLKEMVRISKEHVSIKI